MCIRDRTRYIDFVRDGKGLDSIWDNKIHPVILGDEVYIELIYKHHVDESSANVKEISRLERNPTCKPVSSYFQPGRDESESILAAYKSGGFTLKEIADYCCMHYSTVSRIISQLEEV